jgi:pimeloyl-ACP methyl ester carboxylesterase
VRDDDVLASHLERLPGELPAGFSVRRLTADRGAWMATLRSLFAQALAGAEAARPPAPSPAARAGFDEGLHVRRFGPPGARPLLYLHETPGGARQAQELLAALGARRRVHAPDLPGCGLSAPLAEPTLAAYVARLAAFVASLGEAVDVVAEHTATPIAAALIAHAPERFGAAVLHGLLLPDAQARAQLRDRYAPALALGRGGEGLHQAWHMLRDQEIHWPWFEDGAAGRIPGAPDLDGARLHRRLLDVLIPGEAYGDAVRAAFEADAAALIAGARTPLLVTAGADPRLAWAQAAAALRPGVEIAQAPGDRAALAELALDFLDRVSPPATGR